MICENIEIWENGEYNGAVEEFKPILSTYVLKDNGKKGAVLICPGGGYAGTSAREAEAIAIEFNRVGYNAFVIYYSCYPNKHPQPIFDVTRAMCIIRERAEEWNVDSDKIAVIGFSAGGHLAGSLGVHWNKPYLLDVPRMESGKNKPNALILSYPVISGGEFAHRGSFDNLIGKDASAEMIDEMSLENHVSKDTPPTFLWHTVEDTCVPVENSLLFAKALRKNDIPFEMHIYPEGCHGLSLANEITWEGNDNLVIPHVASWIKLCTDWLGIVFK